MLAWFPDPTAEADRPHLPLLLLHGYADRLAAHGRHWGTTVTQWAEGTLAPLTFLTDRPALVATSDAIRRRPGELQKARKAALERYATDLLGADRPCDQTFGATVGVCMRELVGHEDTFEEMLAHLRARMDRAGLNRRHGLG